MFTAGLKNYAEGIVRYLDPERQYVSCILTRKDCTKVSGNYVKDLRVLKDRNLKDVIIVDDTQEAFSCQPENGICICAFTGEKADFELEELAEFLARIADVEDVRPHIVARGTD